MKLMLDKVMDKTKSSPNATRMSSFRVYQVSLSQKDQQTKYPHHTLSEICPKPSCIFGPREEAIGEEAA